MERIFREEHGRVVATLARRLGDLDRAEEAAGEALVAALETWPRDGVPPNPGAWLTTTGARRGIDRLRRESHRDDKHRAAQMITDDTPHEPVGVVEDDRLRLVFTCCHPALAPEARVALTLRLLGGLSTAEIARAFLVPETTMAQRLTRAKRKIAGAGIPYRVPGPADLPERVAGVLAVVYLVFNEGYLASGASEGSGAVGGGMRDEGVRDEGVRDEGVRDDLAAEAVRLARVLHELMPGEHEVTGLLALLLLTQARRDARVRDGVLVPLPDQDRSRWDRSLVEEGHRLVRACLAAGRPGRYQLLAAVNAVHTDAPTGATTDWHQVVALYDQLAVLDPGPVVALNRAVAVAELDGPSVGLALVDRLPLTGYDAWHATRADLLRRLDRHAEARAAYDAALQRSDNPAQAAYLRGRRDSLPRT